MLALRDVRLRYKQTALGVVWVVLQPVLAAAVFAVIFGRFAKLPSEGHPYLLFAFSGLLAWNLLSGILQRAGNSLVAEARLITKVYFPRIIIPLSAATSALLDFFVALTVLGVLLAWYGLWPGAALLLLPVALALTLILAVGVSLWISALNVRYRDFGYALPFLIQVWMYASPVVYGLSLIPEPWRVGFAFNPMVGAINLFRDALLGGASIDFLPVLISFIISVLALITGALYFARVEQDFADAL